MANEYATLANLKLQLGIADSTRDTQLQAVLTDVSRQIDDICGRRFYLDSVATARSYRTVRSVVADRDGDGLIVDDIGSTSGLVVEIGGGTSWVTVTDYEAEPGTAPSDGSPITLLRRPLGTWRWARLVRVTARWGWPSVPDPVARATLLQAGRMYRRKDSPEGVLGSSEWGPVRVARMDPDVAALLANYTRMDGFA